MQPTVQLVRGGDSKAFAQAVKDLDKLNVYVGIPEEKNARKGEPIGNAQLAFILTHGVRAEAMRAAMTQSITAGATYSAAHAMYIHANGSPLWHTPPRPIIEPAIQATGNKEPIANELTQAAMAALQGDKENTVKHLKRAGMTAQNAARAWFTDSRNGWPANAPSTIDRKGSDRPNIDKGELRKAITFVVKAE